MDTFRLKTSDITGIQIDPEWQQMLLKEHEVHTTVGDYLYYDIRGVQQTMPKDRFERLFSKLEVTATA